MSASLEASLSEIAEWSFLPDQHFLAKLLDLVARLRLESESRGYPMLAHLLDIAKSEVEGRLSSYEKQSASEEPRAPDSAEDGEEVMRMAEKLAHRARSPFAPSARRLSSDVVRLPRAIGDDGMAVTSASPLERSEAKVRMINFRDKRPSRTLEDKLRLALEIRNFDTDQLAFSLAVLDDATPRYSEDGSLRMTLTEMDVFLNALKSANDGIELMAVGARTEVTQSDPLPQIEAALPQIEAPLPQIKAPIEVPRKGRSRRRRR